MCHADAATKSAGRGSAHYGGRTCGLCLSSPKVRFTPGSICCSTAMSLCKLLLIYLRPPNTTHTYAHTYARQVMTRNYGPLHQVVTSRQSAPPYLSASLLPWGSLLGSSSLVCDLCCVSWCAGGATLGSLCIWPCSRQETTEAARCPECWSHLPRPHMYACAKMCACVQRTWCRCMHVWWHPGWL